MALEKNLLPRKYGNMILFADILSISALTVLITSGLLFKNFKTGLAWKKLPEPGFGGVSRVSVTIEFHSQENIFQPFSITEAMINAKILVL